MTLVVGVPFGSRIQILSDTAISSKEAVRPNLLPGRLKSIVVSPSLCVSYSGPANLAIDPIRELYHEGAIPQEAVGRLLDVHLESGQEAEFMVAALEPEPYLVVIKDGQASRDEEVFWIGSAEAAQRYVAGLPGVVVPANADVATRPLIRAQESFMRLLQNQDIIGVGGLRFRVGSGDDGFNYLDEAMAFYPPQEIPSGVATPLFFGGSSLGGFAYTVLVPDRTGTPAVGAHFFQGALGFLYLPMHEDEPISYRDVTHDEFRDKVLRDHGISMNGLRIG